MEEEARKQGSKAARHQGIKEARKQGSKEARKQGSKEARKQGRQQRNIAASQIKVLSEIILSYEVKSADEIVERYCIRKLEGIKP